MNLSLSDCICPTPNDMLWRIHNLEGPMPYLAWIDHDPAQRERMRRALALLSESDTRDELGLGSVRDAFADLLFPGTSTIQTRLRYMLFVPWAYREMERQKVPSKDISKKTREHELSLVKPLVQSGADWGVFGSSAGAELKRLPSSVYWAGLRSWGIFGLNAGQGEYHGYLDAIYRNRALSGRGGTMSDRERREAVDDLSYRGRVIQTWDPALPEVPEDFPGGVSFELTCEEAEYLRDRILANHPDSLLAFLAREQMPNDARFVWRHPDYGAFSEGHQELITHARLVSEAMHGAALMYNLLLAETAEREELADKRRRQIEDWRRRLNLGELKEWNLHRLWTLVTQAGHRIPYRTREFLENWVQMACSTEEDLADRPDAKVLVLNQAQTKALFA